MHKFIFERYLPSHPVREMFLAGRWQARDLPSLGNLVKWSKDHGIHTVVIGPTQEYDAPLPRLLAYAIAKHDPVLPYRHRVSGLKTLDTRMKALAQSQWDVPYVSLIDTTCNSSNCREFADDTKTVPLLFDDDHYTNEGSKWLVSALVANGTFR